VPDCSLNFSPNFDSLTIIFTHVEVSAQNNFCASVLVAVFKS
jgi:hypothetical protein